MIRWQNKINPDGSWSSAFAILKWQQKLQLNGKWLLSLWSALIIHRLMSLFSVCQTSSSSAGRIGAW
jgi:hypothetical protein